MRDNGSLDDADRAMERYSRGDAAAFAQVYDAVAPRIHAYLRRRMRDRARTEDLVQRTLLHIHRARGSFIPGSRVLPWAFAIARRLLIDELRKERRDALSGAEMLLDEGDVASLGFAADQQVEAQQLAARLQVALLTLPENQRSAFELMRFDGLSHAEAAQTLGVTVSAVKLRAHRAYVALRAVLGGHHGEQEPTE